MVRVRVYAKARGIRRDCAENLIAPHVTAIMHVQKPRRAATVCSNLLGWREGEANFDGTSAAEHTLGQWLGHIHWH